METKQLLLTLSFLSILFLSPPAVRADYKIVVGDFGIINVFPIIDNSGTGNQIRGIMGYNNHTGTTLYFENTVWKPLFFTGTTVLNGFTFTGGFMSSSNLTAQIAGIYWATYRLSGSGQNNHIYFSTVLVNGTNVNEYCEDHKKIAAGGDIVPMGNTCEIRLNVGDNITIAVMDYQGSGNGDYYSGNLNLIRIGD